MGMVHMNIPALFRTVCTSVRDPSLRHFFLPLLQLIELLAYVQLENSDQLPLLSRPIHCPLIHLFPVSVQQDIVIILSTGCTASNAIRVVDNGGTPLAFSFVLLRHVCLHRTHDVGKTTLHLVLRYAVETSILVVIDNLFLGGKAFFALLWIVCVVPHFEIGAVRVHAPTSFVQEHQTLHHFLTDASHFLQVAEVDGVDVGREVSRADQVVDGKEGIGEKSIAHTYIPTSFHATFHHTFLSSRLARG
mmetsp:Transcript_49920/g.128455  ORF Transcript_49920/g.128455 Transcript_49920/m.128455 type:complete len:247 (-) Transcript_49920:1146-1886(-)